MIVSACDVGVNQGMEEPAEGNWTSDTSAVRKVIMKRLRVPALVLGALALGSTLAFAQDHHEPATEKRAAQAAVNYQYVFGDNISIPPGQETGTSVDCPEGQVPTGGGMGTNTTGNVNPDFMYAVGREWIVRAKNWGSLAENMRPFVICAPGTSTGPYLQDGMTLPGRN
ncbi:hypothetical protein [Kitasatospora sp. NPDC101183]|uniref:hypothetical protein n=1 Tax=Kitasatospora sp. NPDC101183 TaxID=3364100 RepID=UPI0038028EF1